MLSPLESIPFEILNRIYGYLKISSWKFPLGQCSKTLYEVFKSHTEQQKVDLMNNGVLLKRAARMGDNILTQVSFDPEKFPNSWFVSLCLSGNVALTKYIDTYLFLWDNDFTDYGDRKAMIGLGNRHNQACKELLRCRTFKENDEFVTQEIVDEFLSYFCEDMLQDFENPRMVKETFFRVNAGLMVVHGKDTCLYPAFKEYTDQLESTDRSNLGLNPLRKAVILESFYTGIEKVLSYPFKYCPSRDHELREYKNLLGSCVKYALRSPRTNEEAIRKAWNMYAEAIYPESIPTNEIECAFCFALSHDKLDILNEIVKEYITDRRICIDYHKIWINHHLTSIKHFHMWNLDSKTCLTRLLDEYMNNNLMTYDKTKVTLKHLVKCSPDVLHSLSSDEIEKYKYTGLFCPRCLNVDINCGSSEITPHQCKYCKHIFSSGK